MQQQTRSPMIPTTPSPSGMIPTQANYSTPASPHMHPKYVFYIKKKTISLKKLQIK